MDESIHYTVRVEGDMYDHSAFREFVDDREHTEMVEETETTFELLSVEAENQQVLCYHCESIQPCADCEVTIDAVNETEAGVILSVNRRYLCSQECAEEFAMEVMEADT